MRTVSPHLDAQVILKPPSPLDAPSAPTTQRLASLDACRGAIMLMMASAALSASVVARSFPGSTWWQAIAWQCEHAEWVGFRVWDIIQPAFMFMVGVALPFSLASRRARGQGLARLIAHALWRSAVLVLLAVFLTSAYGKTTVWSFANVLAQIGLGYPILFLLALARPRIQWIAALVILLAYWAAFALYPLPPADFDWASVGVPANWPHLSGLAAHWDKNTNFAAAADQWLLNLLPHDKPFVFNRGGYQTLNFVPSIATMTFGLLAGGLLKSGRSIPRKLGWLILLGAAGVALGWGIDAAGLCPMVKRIWTPSWAICSAGAAALVLAGFVAIIEGIGLKKWAFPFVVVGLNPITLYVLWQLSSGFIRESFKRHLGQSIFEIAGKPYAPMLERGTVLVILWLVVLWMYRRKVFVRV